MGDSSWSRELFQSAFGATYYQGYVDSLGEASVIFAPQGTLSSFERLEQRKTLAGGLLVASGGLLVGALVCGLGAGLNQSAYEHTELQRPAAEAHDRVMGLSTAAGISGGLALGSALAGWLLWPKQGVAISAGLNHSSSSN